MTLVRVHVCVLGLNRKRNEQTKTKEKNVTNKPEQKESGKNVNTALLSSGLKMRFGCCC